MSQDPKPLPYLQHSDAFNFDINLQVQLKGFYTQCFISVEKLSCLSVFLVMLQHSQPLLLNIAYYVYSSRLQLCASVELCVQTTKV